MFKDFAVICHSVPRNSRFAYYMYTYKWQRIFEPFNIGFTYCTNGIIVVLLNKTVSVHQNHSNLLSFIVVRCCLDPLLTFLLSLQSFTVAYTHFKILELAYSNMHYWRCYELSSVTTEAIMWYICPSSADTRSQHDAWTSIAKTCM